MTRVKFSLVLLAALLIGTQATAQPVAVPSPAAPKAASPAPVTPATYGIAAIHAYLYYHSTGTIGDKDLTAGDVGLWNVMIGRGEGDGPPATAVLVLTELVGPSFANVPGKLVVEAKINSKTLARQTYDVAEFFAEKNFRVFLPLLLLHVACEKVTLTASLTMKGTKAPAKLASIPFKCGE